MRKRIAFQITIVAIAFGRLGAIGSCAYRRDGDFDGLSGNVQRGVR